MHLVKKLTTAALTLSIITLGSCKHETTVGPSLPPEDSTTIVRPSTSIPDQFVGTWYAEHNSGPLTEDWAKKTFQGEQGFREFRTMVFTKDGQNAVEYSTEIFNYGGETQQHFYKITGTLVYGTNPEQITFYAQSGVKRVFSSSYSGYKESAIVTSDMRKYQTSWEKPQATNMSSSKNSLTATVIDQGGRYASRYTKVGSGPTTPTSGLPSPTPITTGTSVKIGELYYPTVVIGNQEWLATNYAGPGSLKETNKPQYGTFLEYDDLAKIPLPVGWRIPSRQDYNRLLDSQGITYNEWGTDGDDVPSKRLLGQLMATNVWTKKDGYANNKSGFNAMPADVRRPRGVNYGEGTNCTLWVSDRDAEDNPMTFNLIQLPTSTYAAISPQPIGLFALLIPVRLVRDRQ